MNPLRLLACLLLFAATARPAQAEGAAAPAPEGAAVVAAEGDAVTEDDPEVEVEVKAESAELEQARAAEQNAHPAEPGLVDDPTLRDEVRHGLESPLEQRLRDAFGREGSSGSEPAGRIAALPELDHDLRRLQAEYDIPIDVNEQVVGYVRFFQNHPVVRKHFVKWLGRSHKYIPVFRRILQEEGLPQDTVYLAMIESGFANMATSRAKAVGAWQFIPETGRRMGLRQDFWVDERRDPEKAARAAAKYLKELYGQTGDWRLAWAGYNAGVGKIYRARAAGQHDFWTMTRGSVLKPETKGYVPKLMAAAILAKHHEAFGFTAEEIERERWQEYDEITVPHATSIAAVAEAAGVAEKAILDLNPALRRTCTPPRPTTIKVPRGQGEVFARNWPEVSQAVGKLAFAQHRVGRGESLKLVARRYGVDPSTLARMNGFRPGRRVPAGTELVVPLNALSRTTAVAFAAAEPLRPEPKAAAQPARRTARADVRLASAREPAPSSSVRGAAGGKVAGKLVAATAGARRVHGRAPQRQHATVRVRSGDTLWSIAQRFGVAVDELCRWNGIRNTSRFTLPAGKKLVVYPRPGQASNAAPGVAARAG